MLKENSIKRFETLDAFRGLSAVMIILYHSQFYQDTQANIFIHNSYIFVDFFFVLSGFVMAYSYQELILNGIEFKKFTLLRFARLYPLHLFTLCIWIPFVAVKYYLYLQGVGVNDPSEINNIFTFVQNLFLLQGVASSTSWNFPSWSIGVEFYTYIIFFAVMFFSSQLSNTTRYAVIVSIAFVSYLIMTIHHGEPFILQNMFRCVSEFFLGILIYALYKHIPLTISNKIVATFLEVSILFLIFYFVSNIDNNMYRHYTIVLFALVVYLFSIENIGYISKLLMANSFQHLGKISYSIYMTHAIIVLVAYKVLVYLLHLQPGNVIGIPKGVVFEYALFLNIFLIFVIVWISTLTYKYIEMPGQAYLKRKFGKK